MNATPELRALTGARGVAAWWVVLYHIRGSIAGLPDGVEAVLAKGYLAVDFFFLLSGFVIWLSWHERFAARRWRATPGFLQRRIARVWPLHAVVLAGGVGLALLLAATGRHDPREFPFGELPLHLLLVQNWGTTAALAWNDPAWSISCELAAYLLFPALALAIDWRRVPAPAIVASVVALVVLLHTLFARAGADDIGDMIPRLGVARCMLEFAAGGALAALWLRWRERPAAAAPAAILAAAFGGATVAGALPETLGVPLAFAAALLALALVANAPANPLAGRVAHTLGEWSYATYLGHFLLWVAFKLAFVSDAAAVPAALVALYLALVLASSALLYVWVERPAQRAINAITPPRPPRLAR